MYVLRYHAFLRYIYLYVLKITRASDIYCQTKDMADFSYFQAKLESVTLITLETAGETGDAM